MDQPASLRSVRRENPESSITPDFVVEALSGADWPFYVLPDPQALEDDCPRSPFRKGAVERAWQALRRASAERSDIPFDQPE